MNRAVTTTPGAGPHGLRRPNEDPTRGTHQDPPTPAFLFSLPRSGSTLVQRVVGSHPDVATASEPWLLLPFLYTLKDRGVYAEYNHTSVVSAIEDFCAALPGGRDDYLAGVRELALRMYGGAAPNGERYFLDKTPRYHLIAEQIFETFPAGKHIFLWRNPLSVVASIIETWGGGRWNVYRHKVDLFDGMENLIAAYRRHANASHAVRYEDLIRDPAAWEGVFGYLDLPHDAATTKRLDGAGLGGRKGDPTGTRRYEAISSEPLERWRAVLNTPFRKAWCKRYLRWLGRERLGIMGYDLDELLAQLDEPPTSYGRAISDAWRSAYGVGYDLLEPKMLKQKLGQVRTWRKVHPHK